MVGDEKPKKKKHRLIRITGSILSLAVLTYIAVMLITGRGVDITWFLDLFSSGEPAVMASEYNFDVGRDRVFADLGGSLAAAGSLGVQVLDIEGDETLRDPFRMSNPAIKAMKGRAIAFDIGGTAISVFNNSQVIASIETDNIIISASINRNGWFCVCTQGSRGYKGFATVYNSKGNEKYCVSLSSGYILSAALSPDNSSLAVLNLTDDCSRITFYNDLSNESADSTFDLPGNLVLDIWYTDDSNLVAISRQALITVNKDGLGSELFNFSGKRLGAYTYDDSFYALHLYDYGIGFRGQLITLDIEGNIIGEVSTDQELISMSSGGGNLAVLSTNGFNIYSSKLEVYPPSVERASISGATRILPLESGAALAVGEHLAVTLQRARPEG